MSLDWSTWLFPSKIEPSHFPCVPQLDVYIPYSYKGHLKKLDGIEPKPNLFSLGSV